MACIVRRCSPESVSALPLHVLHDHRLGRKRQHTCAARQADAVRGRWQSSDSALMRLSGACATGASPCRSQAAKSSRWPSHRATAPPAALIPEPTPASLGHHQRAWPTPFLDPTTTLSTSLCLTRPSVRMSHWRVRRSWDLAGLINWTQFSDLKL